MDHFTQYALAAAQQAITMSGLVIGDMDPYRVGTIVGSGVGGLEIWKRNMASCLPQVRPVFPPCLSP